MIKLLFVKLPLLAIYTFIGICGGIGAALVLDKLDVKVKQWSKK